MSISKRVCSGAVAALLAGQAGSAEACTFITLKGKDDSVIVSRTMEWGTFDLSPVMSYVPAGTAFSAMPMPDGKAGAQWVSKYDVMGVTLLGQMLFGDGVNAAGLNVFCQRLNAGQSVSNPRCAHWIGHVLFVFGHEVKPLLRPDTSKRRINHRIFYGPQLFVRQQRTR